MASIMELSLEDIIQKKKRENPRGPGQPKGKIKKNVPPIKRNAPPAKTLPITDARNKIISKKRNQITDAREKLAQLAKHKDARLKLDTLRQKRAIQAQGRNLFQTRGMKNRPPPRKEIVFGDPSRHVVSQPMSQSRLQGKQQPNTRALHSRSFLESRSIGRSLVSDRTPRPRLKPILRTVENDLELADEPMDEDDDIVMTSPLKPMLNRKANLQLRIVAHNSDARESRHTASFRLSSPETRQSPPRPQSILKKRPMAALRSEKKTEKPDKPAVEFRIIVSNLRNTVTAGDIDELFGDVGGMTESRLVRPGTAEVIYNSLENAKKAVELYHNRQLDGQPMNCLLVTPRPTTNPSTTARNGSKPALYSSSSNVEPDISTFHKVLFSNF